MGKKMNFLIVDGYPRESREEFNGVGMRLAGELYTQLLLKYLPNAGHEILFPSDEDTVIPDEKKLLKYTGVLWPGCNLTIFNEKDERVTRMKRICKNAYIAGVPQFGSCWGIQMAVYVAGGSVAPNPKGREMGIGRNIVLTDKGKKHPMFRGKPPVYNHFVSHDDMVMELPRGAMLLAGNDFSSIQAVEVKHKNGIFWAVQYHPEYDLHEMARLIVARGKKLVELGFFKSLDDVDAYVDRLEKLHSSPESKDLRWQLAIDQDILSDSIRELEFANWVKFVILHRK